MDKFSISVQFDSVEDIERFEKHFGKSFKFETVRVSDKVIAKRYSLQEHPAAGRHTIFNDSDIQQMINDHEAGLSLQQLAKKYNCSKSTIQNYLRKFK